MSLTSTLTDIANAIRTRLGTSGVIPASQFTTKVNSILDMEKWIQGDSWSVFVTDSDIVFGCHRTYGQVYLITTETTIRINGTILTANDIYIPYATAAYWARFAMPGVTEWDDEERSIDGGTRATVHVNSDMYSYIQNNPLDHPFGDSTIVVDQ